jgi:hypothetical protein
MAAADSIAKLSLPSRSCARWIARSKLNLPISPARKGCLPGLARPGQAAQSPIANPLSSIISSLSDAPPNVQPFPSEWRCPAGVPRFTTHQRLNRSDPHSEPFFRPRDRSLATEHWPIAFRNRAAEFGAAFSKPTPNWPFARGERRRNARMVTARDSPSQIRMRAIAPIFGPRILNAQGRTPNAKAPQKASKQFRPWPQSRGHQIAIRGIRMAEDKGETARIEAAVFANESHGSHSSRPSCPFKICSAGREIIRLNGKGMKWQPNGKQKIRSPVDPLLCAEEGRS